MTTLREAAQQALKALEDAKALLNNKDRTTTMWFADEITALRAALAQEQAEPDISRCPQCNGPADNGFDRSFPPSPYLCTQCMAETVEPVAWMVYTLDGKSVCVTDNPADFGEGHRALPLYTVSPQRTMVPLTDEEIDAEWHELDGEASAPFKRVIRKFARSVEKTVWEKNVWGDYFARVIRARGNT